MKLSIIVPVYNGEKYLERCLKSILTAADNDKDYELIFINDGSKDKSLDILLEYRKKFKNIQIISQKNKGLSEARNVGIRNAKGKYISFLDCDDSIEKNYFKDILNVLSSDCDLIVFGMQRINDNNKVYLKKLPIKDSLEDLLYNSYACNKIVKKEIIEKNNIYFPVGKYYEDAHTIPKIYFLSKRIIYLDKIYYNYYLNKGSITQKRNDKRLLHLLEAYIEIGGEFKNKPNEYKTFLKNFKNEFLLKILPNNSVVFILKNYKEIKDKLFLYEEKWNRVDDLKVLISILYPKYYLKKILRR